MSEQALSQLLNALRSILPAEYIAADHDDCARYAVQGVVPSCVVAPGSVEELGRVMHVATELHAATVPWAAAHSSTSARRLRASICLFAPSGSTVC